MTVVVEIAVHGSTDQPTARSGRLARLLDASEYCGNRSRLRRTVTIALVVGTILTLLNQGDVILAGTTTAATGAKAVLNYLVPFIVSNLGLLSGRPAASTGPAA